MWSLVVFDLDYNLAQYKSATVFNKIFSEAYSFPVNNEITTTLWT